MAFGSAIVGAGPDPGGRRALVGAPPERRIVGAGAMAVGAPAGRRGIVGAGAGGRGGPPVGEGGAVGTGGLTGGVMGTVADGTAGGASAAFKVIRTVSFFKGTLDVCLDGAGGRFSFSLMRSKGLRPRGLSKPIRIWSVKPPA